MENTLNVSGGWILVKSAPPTKIKVPVLSLWYAMPKEVYECGDNDVRMFGGDYWPSKDKSRVLNTLWRVRRGIKVDDVHVQECRKFFGIYEDGSLKKDLAHIDIEMKVEILTPEGSLCLMPHEFNVINNIDDYLDMVDGEHCMLKELCGVAAASKIKDVVFYCQQRGLSKTDALKMVGGEVRKQNVFYLQLHEAYGEYFGLTKTNKYNFT